MKRTYVKLLARGVRHSLSRFLSILFIVAIGTGFLAGLTATMPVMKTSAESYYNAHLVHDIDIKGTLGITQDDIDALDSLDFVERAVGTRITDIIVSSSEATYTARIYGMDLSLHGTGRLTDDFTLASGRMPSAPGECVLASPNGFTGSHTVGEVYTLSDENKDYENISDTYALDTLTVVGIASSPLYMSVESEPSSVGTGTVSMILYTDPGFYSLDVFTDALITVSGARSINSFDDEYEELLETCVERTEDFGKERSAVRDSDVRDEAQQKIDDAWDEYYDAEADANKKLSDARAELDDAQLQLNDARTELEDGKVELEDAKKKLSRARRAAKAEIDAKRAELEAARPMLPPEQYAAMSAQIDAAEKDANAKLASAKIKITDAETRISDAEAEISDAESELNDAEAEYADAKADAEVQLSDARIKITDAQDELDALDSAEWYVFDRGDIVSHASYKSNAEKMNAIAKVFPMFLFLVAALVSLTTMTRMVEEERTQIGTLKALGYTDGAIMLYYIGYSVLASLSGSAIGITVGFYTLPVVIYNVYLMMYTMPSAVTAFYPDSAVIIAAIAVLCTTAATFFACKNTLLERACTLMLPKAPKAGKRVFLERITFIWDRMKFTSKVTARNILRYKKRFFMTLIGIAGCTALLVTGFGLRTSIHDIVDIQFGELYTYEAAIKLKTDSADISDETLSAALTEQSGIVGYAAIHAESGKLNSQNVSIYVPRETDALKREIVLRERRSGADIEFNENSVVLTEKLCETEGLHVGDRFTLRDADGKEAEFTLSAIAENYVTSYAFMSANTYECAFGNAPEYKLLLADVNESTDTESLSKTLLTSDEVSLVQFNSTIRESFSSTVRSIDYIVLVLIASAGALAVIVVYNLTNINISERKKELATIKVLGFYESEVAKYIYRETSILALLGTALGLVFGVWLHSFVVRTSEVDAVMFGRTLTPMSFLLAAAVTLLFTLAVDLIMLPNLRRIDMVDSMKAND